MAQTWNAFTKSITIKTTKQKLYEAFATRKGTESWFLRSCAYKNPQGKLLPEETFARAGDKYKWLWFGYDDDTYEEGEILQANESDLFEFTFNANGKTDIKVKVSFTEQEGEWRVSLYQYNIPEDEESRIWYFVGCGEGWTFYLANLKSILEGGIDLRNKNVNIQQVINA